MAVKMNDTAALFFFRKELHRIIICYYYNNNHSLFSHPPKVIEFHRFERNDARLIGPDQIAWRVDTDTFALEPLNGGRLNGIAIVAAIFESDGRIKSSIGSHYGARPAPLKPPVPNPKREWNNDVRICTNQTISAPGLITMPNVSDCVWLVAWIIHELGGCRGGGGGKFPIVMQLERGHQNQRRPIQIESSFNILISRPRSRMGGCGSAGEARSKHAASDTRGKSNEILRLVNRVALISNLIYSISPWRMALIIQEIKKFQIQIEPVHDE